jgi:hypothetical protein
MRFYWAVKWKNFDVEDLLVSDGRKEIIEREWLKKPEYRQSQTFTLDGESYSFNSIDSITKTSKKIEDTTKLLYASEASFHSRAPMLNEAGEVVTNWYKKLVSSKEYYNFYGKHPSYRTLDKDPSGIWVAFRLAERQNGDRPNTVELCNESEVERLWRVAYS